MESDNQQMDNNNIDTLLPTQPLDFATAAGTPDIFFLCAGTSLSDSLSELPVALRLVFLLVQRKFHGLATPNSIGTT